MSLYPSKLRRLLSSSRRLCVSVQWLTTQPNVFIKERAPRTTLSCPKLHLKEAPKVLGKFFSIPEAEFNRVIVPFLKDEHNEQLRVFQDLSLLARRPAVQLIKDFDEISRLQQEKEHSTIDSNHALSTVPRYVLYGQPGSGISCTLAHVAWFASANEWLVFNFCKAYQWLDRCNDMVTCGDYHQAQIKDKVVGSAFDFTSRSAEWLRAFLAFNEPTLNKLNPTITQDVTWTRKDIAPAGTPWIELINFATARTKYATDCIGILLREMRRLASTADGPPCVVLVDGINFLWCRGTRLKDTITGNTLTVDHLSIVHHLKRAMQGDWKRGAILTSVTPKAAWPTDREKYTPGYLLGKDGFEFLDPFIPVHIEGYSPAEIDACLQFYAENEWLTNPAALTPEGRKEIIFLADGNPRELDKVVAEW